MKNKNSKYLTITKNFSLFTIIGVIYAIVQIFILWILIDLLNYHTLITTTLIVTLLYTLKFYTYVYVKLMKNSFMQYNIINLILLGISIILIWVLVDFLGMYASLSSFLTTALFFLIRFAVLSKTKLIQN